MWLFLMVLPQILFAAGSNDPVEVKFGFTNGESKDVTSDSGVCKTVTSTCAAKQFFPFNTNDEVSNNNDTKKPACLAVVDCVGPGINGVCGSEHGTGSGAPIVANKCATGTATVTTGSGPWNWSCDGSGGGSNANCTKTSLVACNAHPRLNDSCVGNPGAGIKDGDIMTQTACTASGSPCAAIMCSGTPICSGDTLVCRITGAVTHSGCP